MRTSQRKSLEVVFVATAYRDDGGSFPGHSEDWLATAKDPRWHRPYTELIYQPMLEVMNYLRANGYRTYIVTGGGQDFVRVYSRQVYGIPPEQVIGSALDTNTVTTSRQSRS